MPLTSGEKKLLVFLGGGLLLGAAFGAFTGTAASDDFDDDFDDDDDDDDSTPMAALRPGRGLELTVLGCLDAVFGDDNVLDNPLLETDDGNLIKPDAVVLDGREVRQVRECKDKERLATSDVLQAAGYDHDLEPWEGTVLDIASRTKVPSAVEELADDLDIDIERWDDPS